MNDAQRLTFAKRKKKPAVGSLAALKSECCALFGVAWSDITKRGHAARYTSAKLWFAYNALQEGFSAPRVGQIMNRHHSTVLRNAAKYQVTRNAPPVTGFVLNE